MKHFWALTPVILSLAMTASADEFPRAAVGDQLAALAGMNAVTPRAAFPASGSSVDLSYDVRRIRRSVGESRPRALPLPPRSVPSLDSFGIPLAGSGAVVDLYPFRQGFRISAGARSDLTDARFMSRSRRSLGESDRVIATLTSKEDGFTPYVGIGYARRMLDGRLELAVDAGLLFDREQGSGDAAKPVVAASTEAGADVSEGPKVGESSEVYPVVGLSMKYKF